MIIKIVIFQFPFDTFGQLIKNKETYISSDASMRNSNQELRNDDDLFVPWNTM